MTQNDRDVNVTVVFAVTDGFFMQACVFLLFHP